MKKEVDYLIIGQGLAGSLLAYQLLERGKTVQIIDNHHNGASSSIAAGIINPITGRRFAKSWRIDEFLPFSKAYYQKLEQKFAVKIFHDRSVLRFLNGNKDINDWHGRSSWEGFTEYMKEFKNMEELAHLFHLSFGIGEINPAAQVDIPVLINIFKKYFKEKDIIDFQDIDYQAVKYNGVNGEYNGVQAKKVVYCEGHRARFNPWFEKILFEPAKGEVLFLKIPNLNFEQILKSKIMMAPFGDDIYWTGSNYEWDALNDQPTAAFKQDFVKRIAQTLKLPFEVIDHKAAIRPTIKDRRPILGVHPDNAQIAIFNGLGTKGASLGPFWAKEMAEHLIDDKPLDPEVDIRRFFIA
ncbi:MAG: glycine oxidase [Saprospiraceae bacterium]